MASKAGGSHDVSCSFRHSLSFLKAWRPCASACLPSGIDRVQRGRQRSFRRWVNDVFAPVSGNCLATDAFWWVVSRMQACMGDDRDTHVKSRGEGVEDLVGAHVGVGVDDTLAAALHDLGCEGGTGCVVECALPAASNAGFRWCTRGEILEVRSTTAGCR
jgi:hypothetical protein